MTTAKLVIVLILLATAATVIVAFKKSDKKIDSMADKSTDTLTSPIVIEPTSSPSAELAAELNLSPIMAQTAPTISETKQSSAILHTTAGDITIKFNLGSTSNTIANFIKLSQSNFYNGTIFHRVIKGFMIQGGDPKGDGSGGPGYSFADEPFAGEYTRGIVAMANSGPNTNGSQFFIMHQDYALPKNYVIFGKVVAGMETVDKIAESPTQPGGENSSPVTPIVIKSVEIVE